MSTVEAIKSPQLLKNITILLYIFLGGGIGAYVRYGISLSAMKINKPMWVGTFTVNIIGCLLIGYIAGLVLAKSNLLSDTLKLGLTVDLLGAYHFYL